MQTACKHTQTVSDTLFAPVTLTLT